MQPVPPPLEANLGGEPGVARPLYSIRQISWGSYLGGPAAGAWLLALTLGRLGRGEERRAVYAWGAFATLATALVGMVAPTDLPNAVIPGLGVVAMGALAQRRLGREFHWREPRGKATASFWRTLGGSLVALPLSLLGFLAVVESVDLHPMNRLTIGKNEIYYELFATRADAERLGGFLQKEHLLTEASEWSVTLREGVRKEVVIAFAVPSEAARDQEFVRELDVVRAHVLGVLYPEGSVHFELRNALGATIRRIP